MDNVIKTERKSVKQLLASCGVRASAFLPERITPPIAVITSGEPYISFESTLCEGELNLIVTLVTPYASNEVETDVLDEMIIKVVELFINNNWSILNIAKPYILQANNANYLSVDISISTSITVGG